MSKRQDSKKSKKPEIQLAQEENRELEMILDRLSVQSPEGQSLEGYILSLHKALKGREALVVALIERLAMNPTEVGFRTVSGLQNLVENKTYHRIAKQALYRFQQRGWGALSGKSEEQKVVLVQSESRESLAHFAPGPEVFWLVSAFIKPPGHKEPLVVTAFPEDGFRRFSVKIVKSSPRLYREYLQKISNHLSRKPCEVPLWHMARLFWELTQFCNAREQAGDVERIRQILKPYYDPQKLPYAYTLMPELEHPEKRFHEIDPDLLLNDMAYPWLFFSKEELLPYWQKIRDMETSVLVIPQEIQEERSVAIMQKAADELCVGKTRVLWQRFFEEEAMWLKLAAKEDLALWAWIVARHLATEDSLSENPVCLKIIGTAMLYYWPEEFRAGEDKTKPFQVRDSGLIVP